MGLDRIASAPITRDGPLARPAIGHAHFWERAVSRRNMLLGTTAAAGFMVGRPFLPPRFLTPARAATTATEPRPIPGGIVVLDQQRFHAYPPGRMNPLDPASPISEPSTITDFDGVLAIAQTLGRGTGVEKGVEAPMTFDSDMRFMAGRYIGMDGQTYTGTFGFI